MTRPCGLTWVPAFIIDTSKSGTTVIINSTFQLNWCNCYKKVCLIRWKFSKPLIFLRRMHDMKPFPLVPGLHVHSGWWFRPTHEASSAHVLGPQTGSQVWLMKSQAWSCLQSLSVLHSTLTQATRGLPWSPALQTHRALWNSTVHSAPRPHGRSELRHGFRQFSLIQALLRGQSLSVRHSGL